MAHGVTEHDGSRAAANRRRVETLYGVGVGANRVFRDVHRGESVVDRELDGLLSGALEMIHGPVFDETADRARPQKCGGFNGQADTLRDVRDGANVGFDGARGAVWLDLQPLGDDFACERFHVLYGARPCARQTDVERIDAQRFHQVKDFDFFGDAGIVHARDSAGRRAAFRHSSGRVCQAAGAAPRPRSSRRPIRFAALRSLSFVRLCVETDAAKTFREYS